EILSYTEAPETRIEEVRDEQAASHLPGQILDASGSIRAVNVYRSKAAVQARRPAYSTERYEPFCACGRAVSQWDGSRRGCHERQLGSEWLCQAASTPQPRSARPPGWWCATAGAGSPGVARTGAEWWHGRRTQSWRRGSISRHAQGCARAPSGLLR